MKCLWDMEEELLCAYSKPGMPLLYEDRSHINDSAVIKWREDYRLKVLQERNRNFILLSLLIRLIDELICFFSVSRRWRAWLITET